MSGIVVEEESNKQTKRKAIGEGEKDSRKEFTERTTGRSRTDRSYRDRKIPTNGTRQPGKMRVGNAGVCVFASQTPRRY